MKDCVILAIVLKTNCTLLMPVRWIALEELFLNDKVARKFPEFDQLADVEKFVFLFTFKDAQMLTWLGQIFV